MIRVGRIKYVNGRQVYPSYEGYTSIIVMTKSSEYGDLGPYVLKTKEGYIFENVWQASKVYEIVPRANEVYTQQYPIPVWKHPMETHMKDGVLTDKYWLWRDKLMNNSMPVRYPVGRDNMHRCKFAIPYPCDKDSVEKLDYIQSRKRTYLPLYVSLVTKHPLFKKLQDRYLNGENLLIIEVDGPHQERLGYYQTEYGVDSNFIEEDTMIANLENLTIMCNDKKEKFGHGYCLAAALLGIHSIE